MSTTVKTNTQQIEALVAPGARFILESDCDQRIWSVRDTTDGTLVLLDPAADTPGTRYFIRGFRARVLRLLAEAVAR
jgi:hypothetical protein